MRSVTLPLPPSANRLFKRVLNRASGRRPLTEEYSRWRDAAGLMANRAGLERLPAKRPVAVSIAMNVDRRSDVDNRCKATLDLLQAARILPDDRWVDRLTLTRDRSVQAGWMKVTLGLLEES